ncbi:hypothetical protein ACH4FE_19935 [Streptomyces celluloflavus]|uniref:hypothetical protein n=1 Tax=Streptomyces celluloflavus TaxID=58344 RepID=UPI00378A6A0E
MVRSRSSGSGGAVSGSSRSARHQPSTWLMCTWFCPKVRGICALASRKNGASPMNAAV